jgi:hypothetical protein
MREFTVLFFSFSRKKKACWMEKGKKKSKKQKTPKRKENENKPKVESFLAKRLISGLSRLRVRGDEWGGVLL